MLARFGSKVIAALFVALVVSIASAGEAAALDAWDINAEGAVLMEATTGRILFEKNADQIMYPASMTKILTAMIALEYINPNQIIFVGPEIAHTPPLSSRAGAGMHEAILGENLIRLMMIPSGNEIAMVLAQNVAERYSGRSVLPWHEAEEIFARLMNQRAQELGALNSNFVNPHGFHHPHHFTTPRDLTLIARAALEIPLLNEIMRESHFVGNGAGQNRLTTWVTRAYNVSTTNLLLREDNEYFYPYATGMRTGFHDQAGHCLAASAERDGFTMISVVFNSGMLSRFRDTITLFEYGFNNYEFRTVQTANVIVGQTRVEGVRFGDPDILEFRTNSGHVEYLSEAELSRIRYRIELDHSLLYVSDSDTVTSLIGDTLYHAPLAAPIYEGQVLGKIVYTLDGDFIFSDRIIATSSVYARDFASDMRFHRDEFVGFIFSLAAVPIWALLVVIITAISMLVRHINEQREKNFYKLKKRYGDNDGHLRW
ncbi:MAG: D-alanyl-D-alanine carboxypeptidase [Defluviitaleaceae bacterium]|nr:D-alanyl-D-alanine carboxypeptidase [Defluviitaleaceae bacterium]